jgi:transcriptional regulator with XRE-family HTH domain
MLKAITNRGDAIAMNFQELHELLRLELVRRIERGGLTGSRLASQTGFQQAHISNFLNGRRSLSLEGLDRVLAAQHLTVDQLVDRLVDRPLPVNLAASAAMSGPSAEPMETVPVVSPSAAMDEARVAESSVIERVPVASSRLYDHRARAAGKRAQWHRFVAVRADAQQTAAMEPLLPPGAIAVLDRHYTSLAPYRAQQPTLYAVRSGAALLLRFVEFNEGRLILRPYSRAFPVQLLAPATHESPADYIVGRVCMVFAEL